MKVWAVGMVKDEADIIGYTLSHLINSGVAGIVIADNKSTDRTLEIISDIQKKAPVPVRIVFDSEVAYFQQQKMTRLAHIAREQGAEIILPFDADELLHDESGRDPIGEIIAGCQSSESGIIGMFWRNHYRTALDGHYGKQNPFEKMAYAELQPHSLKKIAYRWNDDYVIDQGSHGVSMFGEGVVGLLLQSVEVRHFPYRSPEQFIRKIINGGRAYAAGGDKISGEYGSHWRSFYAIHQRLGPGALRRIFHSSYYKSHPLEEGMMYSPAKYLGDDKP